jgi:hypothetical protein
MGFVKKFKSDSAGGNALRARDEGRTVYVHRFEMPHWGSGYSGSVSGAAEVIESIEDQGWKLTHITDSAGEGHRGAFVLVFHRAD